MTNQQPYPPNQPYPGQQYPPPPGAPYPPYQPYPGYRKRPTGVTILAILEILAGIFILILSLGVFGLSLLINTPEFQQQVPDWQQIANIGSTVLIVAAVVLLIIAVLTFFLAWGFLKGKKWAWILGIVLSVLQIVSSVVSSLATGGSVASIGIGIIIPVLILVYLFMPNVKAWFTA